MTKNKFPLLTQEYLRKRWVEDQVTREQIAEEVGCSTGNVMKRIRDWKIFRRGVIKRKSWNEGLTKKTDLRLANMAAAREGEGNPMHGKVAWNAGVRPEDDPRVAKMVKAMREGYDTPETRHKMAAAKVGMRGEKSNNWKGGVSEVNQYLWEGDDYQHRTRAMACLGRELLPGEHVHHIDRNPKNNAHSNLLVMTEKVHLALHRAMSKNADLDQIKWLVDGGHSFERLYEN